MLLSAADLAFVRNEVVSSFPSTCVIERNQPANDSYGTQTENWATLATVPCDIQPTFMQGEGVTAAEIGVVSKYVIQIAYDHDITAKDRIREGSTYYQIEGNDNGISEAGCQSPLCVRID